MLLLIPIIVVALMVGCYLLALVSNDFAYELSRILEATYDFIEYRMEQRMNRLRNKQVSYRAT